MPDVDASTEQAPAHRLHLGVDFGTSQSKLVFRDYGRRGGAMLGDYAVVVRPPNEGAPNDFRIPSSIGYSNGKLYFGRGAEERGRTGGAAMFRSIKMLVAFPEHFHGVRTTPPDGLPVEDLAALYIAYLLHLGEAAVRRYLAGRETRVRLTMTLGVPMSELDNPQLKQVFLRLARTAVEIFRTANLDWSNGLALTHAKDVIEVTKKSIPPIEELEVSDWIRAEAPAALIWAFRSPRVAAGLYAVVDVGAGTTSSSWFRIEGSYYGGRWMKNQMAFYGAACSAPGADAIEELVARRIGVTDPATLRGKLNVVLEQRGRSEFVGMDELEKQIFKTYQTAFGRSYPKHRKQSYWYGASLFLIGGGTLITPVRERLSVRAWKHLNADPHIVDAGLPADLHEENGELYAGDYQYLLVAYGLSHFAADVPEILNPADIPPFKPDELPVRRFRDHEDLYLAR